MYSELVIEVVDDQDGDPDVDHAGEGDSQWKLVDGTEVTATMVEQGLCVGVWDGEVLGTGEEPKELLKGYMEEDYEWKRRVRRREVRKEGAGAGESGGASGKWKVGNWWGQAENHEAGTGEADSGKWKVGDRWGQAENNEASTEDDETGKRRVRRREVQKEGAGAGENWECEWEVESGELVGACGKQ